MIGSTARRRASALGGALFLIAAVLGMPGSAPAQQGGAGASVVKQLEFGTLLPGMPEVITVNDVLRRAEVVVGGTGAVDVRLILPTEMVSPTGARVPLYFGTADAAWSQGPSVTPTPFNPHEVKRVTLAPGRPDVRIYLGGTARVPADQLPGPYTATVTILVTRPNA